MRWRHWWLATAATLVVTLLLSRISGWTAYWPELLAGAVVAMLNGLLARVVNGRAVGRDHDAFLRWMLLGHGPRVALLMIAVLCCTQLGARNMFPFLGTAFGGYFCYLAGEIATLRQVD